MIVFMPRFHSRNYNFENRIKKIAGIDIAYYGHNENTPQYKQKQFYKDAVHLNFDGAKIYTNELANFIKNEHLLD